ncbi:MAG: 50S ribosomal protein L6 [Desulfocapsaceae bacterium]|nr:50S ribosomal protein L6 [Desulfocapsaceae bacterium]
MSRIGKQPIPVPAGIQVLIDGQHIVVKGKKGSLERDIIADIEVVLQENQILVNNRVENKKVNGFRGLTRTLINNMVLGVDKGFSKILIIEGVGYKANVSGSNLSLNVGYSNPVEFPLPDGVTVTVDGNTKITLDCIDKDLLGLTASRIRSIRKPEPYKGKGIRYENEHIVRKVGKAAGK